MKDPATGIDVPPEIAAATLEIERQAREAMAQETCMEGVRNNTERLHNVALAATAQPIPFEEFERRIKLLRANGVRAYRDPYMQVQLDTYKRQPDPAPTQDTIST